MALALQSEAEKAGSERILKVASKLFAEKGYANVSIRDLCKEARTTAPMIYYYFGNKRGLFNAVASSKISMHQFIERLREGTQAGSGRQAVSRFVDVYLSSFPENAFDPGLYISASAKLDRGSAQKISRELDEVHRLATSIIQRGVGRREFRRVDAAKAADCLIGMLNRVIFQRIHFSKTRDVENVKTFITEFFMRAVT